jgi:solute carrier family 25 (mitochondrial ornithine transporter) member 2/15
MKHLGVFWRSKLKNKNPILQFKNLKFHALSRPGQSKDDIGALRTMLAGAVGGLALWIAIFPADVIKSRIQVESSTLSMTEVGRSIIQKEGFAALYNGLKPTIFRTIPATAVLFVVYEYTKKFLSQICNV